MKFGVAFLFWGAMATGAHASSFAVLDSMTEPLGPSMIVLGSPAPVAEAPVAEAPPAAAIATARLPESKVPLASPQGREPGSGERSAEGRHAVDTAVYQVPLPRTLSPSIIAFGDVQMPVSYEKLASIGPTAEKKSTTRPEQMPMVIRGGLVGDAFARPQTAAPAEPVRIEAKARGAAGGSPQPKDAPARRDAPPAAPPPPEPPTRKPE